MITKTVHCDKCGDLIRPGAFMVHLNVWTENDPVEVLDGKARDYEICAPCWWGFRNTFKGVY